MKHFSFFKDFTPNLIISHKCLWCRISFQKRISRLRRALHYYCYYCTFDNWRRKKNNKFGPLQVVAWNQQRCKAEAAGCNETNVWNHDFLFLPFFDHKVLTFILINEIIYTRKLTDREGEREREREMPLPKVRKMINKSKKRKYQKPHDHYKRNERTNERFFLNSTAQCIT